jgi:hypothetical protein
MAASYRASTAQPRPDSANNRSKDKVEHRSSPVNSNIPALKYDTRRALGNPLHDSTKDDKLIIGNGDSSIDNAELASMRARYMGIAQPKTKKRRTNDRKFVFDWSEDADTSSSGSRIPANMNVGFGRGHFGGFELARNPRSGLDRHWTEKELIEMAERDWRICREDFNISTKGKMNSIAY